jgi:hypothetical protein
MKIQIIYKNVQILFNLKIKNSYSDANMLKELQGKYSDKNKKI